MKKCVWIFDFVWICVVLCGPFCVWICVLSLRAFLRYQYSNIRSRWNQSQGIQTSGGYPTLSRLSSKTRLGSVCRCFPTNCRFLSISCLLFSLFLPFYRSLLSERSSWLSSVSSIHCDGGYNRVCKREPRRGTGA